MESNKKQQFHGYNDGAEMWRDNVLSYGVDEATTICGNYLNMNLKCEHSDYERQFCRELFTAMFEATAGKANRTKVVYPYSYEEADKRLEASYYHESRHINAECVRAIDAAIHDSYYKHNHYNLEVAAMVVVMAHGFNRVYAVLAHHIQQHEYDGRYSRTNKKWAENFIFHGKAFDGAYLNAHATLIDSLTDYVRKFYINLDAEQFALQGCEEHGELEIVHGYKIMRSVMVDNNQGYALAYNPDAVDEFVCWQFYNRENGRSYNWGDYGNKQTAVDSYNARVFVHSK